MRNVRFQRFVCFPRASGIKTFNEVAIIFGEGCDKYGGKPDATPAHVLNWHRLLRAVRRQANTGQIAEFLASDESAQVVSMNKKAEKT